MELPTSTVVNRFVAKEKFYNKTSVNTKLRQLFTDEIEKIVWSNKLSAETLNIEAGSLTELQVFEINLKAADISIATLKHIDTFIPYPILYILKKPGAVKAVMAFKELNMKNDTQMKVDSYFETSWKQHLQLELKGRSVDEVYKNYLYQIAPDLVATNHAETREAIDMMKELQLIERQIKDLRRKMANEPSIAKRQELARQRYQLQQRLEET